MATFWFRLMKYAAGFCMDSYATSPQRTKMINCATFKKSIVKKKERLALICTGTGLEIN
jgi:hypothetical protein